MLNPSNLTRRKAYKTRVKRIWRFVQNVSITCPFLKTKWLRMYLLNLEFKTHIHVETFFAKIYATNLAELTFFNLICRLLRLEKRSEDGSEMASSTKLFEASCASQLKFFIIFGILPLSLPNVPLNFAKLKFIFPALRTPFSFQAFARSPRSKSRCVLDLKLPKNSMRSPDYPDILGQS